jgi:hypothetical protein
MHPTADRRRRQARSNRPNLRSNSAFLQELIWLQEIRAIEEHVEHCSIAPTDPVERRMFISAAFIRRDGGSHDQAVGELREVARRTGESIADQRLEKVVNAAYEHPLRCWRVH